MHRFLAPKLPFRDGPAGWPPQLKGQAWIALLVTPVYFLGGLLTSPGGFDVLAGLAGWRSVVSYGAIAMLIALPLCGLLLLKKDKALGMALLVVCMAYLGPMLASLALAAVALGSVLATGASAALAVWSINGIRQVDRNVAPARLQQIRQARIRTEGSEVLIASAGGTDQGQSVKEALKGVRAPWSSVAEYTAALLVLLVGVFLLPSVVALDSARGSPLVWVLWFVLVAVFLAGRGMVNGWLLLLRAGLDGPDSRDG